MRALPIVELHEAVERPLQGAAPGEILSPERDPPVLMENRALQSFDKPVRPRVARQGARDPHAEAVAPGEELAFEFLAVVGQHPPQAPAARRYVGSTSSLRNNSTTAAVTSPRTSDRDWERPTATTGISGLW